MSLAATRKAASRCSRSSPALTALSIGIPAKPNAAQRVVAAGSALSLDSATGGILSAMSRSLPNSGYVPFIRTAVEIIPRNSGALWFDLDGSVVRPREFKVQSE